jgi:hypothetical protein
LRGGFVDDVLEESELKECEAEDVDLLRDCTRHSYSKMKPGEEVAYATGSKKV